MYDEIPAVGVFIRGGEFDGDTHEVDNHGVPYLCHHLQL